MSDSTTFQDTPLYVWLRANAWYLLAGVGLVAGISLYRENAPKWHAKSQLKSWEQFRTLASSPSRPGPDGLLVRMSQAKDDPRIYPWLVFEAVRRSSMEGDQVALASLKPELEALRGVSGALVATSAGSQDMADYLLQKVYQQAAGLPTDFVLVEPDGRKFEIVVSVNSTSTYTLVYGLYETAAANGCAEWVAAIEGGRVNDQSARKVGTMGVTLSLKNVVVPESETPAPWLVERSWGIFHAEGVLTALQVPGKVGQQDRNSVQIVLQDSYHLDGLSTVLGKVVEGWAPFKTALDLAEPTAKIQVVSARLL
jgi:hypothetical protein